MQQLAERGRYIALDKVSHPLVDSEQVGRGEFSSFSRLAVDTQKVVDQLVALLQSMDSFDFDKWVRNYEDAEEK